MGVAISEVFATKEDAEEAYPDNMVGVLKIEEKVMGSEKKEEGKVEEK